MSASLVGSEMCIRDRNRAERSPRLYPKQPSAPPRTGLGLDDGPVLETAVSYTHLTLPTICSV
eukprot:3458785-Alexandrium_andersonii.AAC.1